MYITVNYDIKIPPKDITINYDIKIAPKDTIIYDIKRAPKDITMETRITYNNSRLAFVLK